MKNGLNEKVIEYKKAQKPVATIRRVFSKKKRKKKKEEAKKPKKNVSLEFWNVMINLDQGNIP